MKGVRLMKVKILSLYPDLMNLYGETGGVSDSSYRSSQNVVIYTPNSGFINRTTKSSNNQTKFNVYNIRFIQAILYDKLPVGKCFGVNYNGGSEYNCYLQNVYIQSLKSATQDYIPNFDFNN